MRVGKEVVDYYHATEHLNVALQAAYGEGTGEQRRRFTELADVLLTEPDGVDRVIAKLKELHDAQPEARKKKRAVLAREAKFFANNRRRMRYAELRADNLPVGSGPQEAACKTVASQRMKQSGMRWGDEGGQAILTTRGWSQSDRFDHAWAILAATYQMEVTVMSNVVDLETRRNQRERSSV